MDMPFYQLNWPTPADSGVGAATGKKTASLDARLSFSLEDPRAAAVVPARHPLLDGDKDKVLLLVPIQERMRSGNA